MKRNDLEWLNLIFWEIYFRMHAPPCTIVNSGVQQSQHWYISDRINITQTKLYQNIACIQLDLSMHGLIIISSRQNKTSNILHNSASWCYSLVRSYCSLGESILFESWGRAGFYRITQNCMWNVCVVTYKWRRGGLTIIP